MDLRTLRSFVALAQTPHFTRTAADLHVAQPALSKHIRGLEDELGVRLFDRTRRVVRLSRAGQQLLEPARRVLAAADHVRDVAGQIRDGSRGEVRIGVTPTAPAALLAEVMASFRRAHPTLSCRATQASSGDLLDGLDRGAIDVALVRVEVAAGHAGVRCEPIFRERMVVAVPRRHRLARRRSVSWRMLAGEPLLMVRRDAAPVVHDAILAACRGAGFPPRIAQELHDVHAVMAIVGAGLGIAVVPASTRRPPTVVLRPLVDPVVTTTLGVASSADHAGPDVQAFVALMKGVARTATRTAFS
jgi:DNA-binding transcriptional LysR family regulator